VSESPTPGRRRDQAALRRRRASRHVVVGGGAHGASPATTGDGDVPDAETALTDAPPATSSVGGVTSAVPAATAAGDSDTGDRDTGDRETGDRDAGGRRGVRRRPGPLARVSTVTRAGARPLVVVLVLALLAAATTTAVLGWQVMAAHREDAARAQALPAARSAVQKVFSYDHAHLHKDFVAASKTLTPSFAKKYHASTKDIAPKARQIEAVVSSHVVQAGVVDADADKAVLVMFLNQKTTSTKLDGPRMSLVRVRVTMVSQDGSWLIDKVRAL